MSWTEEQLARLPIKNGFRMRGESMTRLEVFSDAAFAFALTMLVVSVDGIPSNIEELVEALKKSPAFAMSFTQIGIFWIAHRSWSRRYALEDGPATFLTLFMIFSVLVYVYPLRLINSSFLNWVTSGWIQSDFDVSANEDIMTLFVIYGVGYIAMAGSLTLLNLRVLKVRHSLGLNEIEVLYARRDLAAWLFHMTIGVTATLYSLFMPTWIGVFGGFVYSLLGVGLPIVYTYHGNKINKALSAQNREEVVEENED